MRLNADLVAKSAQYLNPLNQFYIDLRGYQIPYLENLTATNDQFECIDLTDNDIVKLDELPNLLRLECLMLANNRIQKVDPQFGLLCPKLTSLILTNNRLGKLQDIDAIAQGCPQLERLSLSGNLVANLSMYRLYAIFKLRNIKVLDFQKVTQVERQQADAVFMKAEILEEVKKTDLLTGETLAHKTGKADELRMTDKQDDFDTMDLAQVDRRELQREIAQIDKMIEQLQQ